MARDLSGAETLIQVCADLEHPDTLAREVRALQDAARTWPQAALQLITLSSLISGTLPPGIQLCLAGAIGCYQRGAIQSDVS